MNDFFIAKIDSSGNVIWANRNGGNNTDIANCITNSVNKSSIIAGSFTSKILHIGNGITVSNSYPSFADIFIAKFNSNGHVVWAKSFGIASFNENCYDVSSDIVGNIYITGIFSGEHISFDSISIYHHGINGAPNLFTAKLDKYGHVLWAKTVDNGLLEYGYSIASDNSGNCYVTGLFDSTLELDGFTLSANDIDFFIAKYDVFVIKYNATGNCSWAKK